MRYAVLITLFSFSTISLANEPVRTTVAENADLVSPLLNGQSTPAVDITNGQGKTESLSAVLGGKKQYCFFIAAGGVHSVIHKWDN